jgi:hypothetical protein
MTTLLQSANVRSGAGAISVTVHFPSNVMPGSLLLCYIFCEDAAATGTSSASDGQNGAYSQNVTNGGVGFRPTSINSFTNALGGDTTVTANSSLASHISAVIEEWSGIVTSSAFDVGANNNGNSTTPSSGATASIAQGNELVVGLVGANSFPTITAGAGFTPDIVTTTIGTEYLVLTSGSGAQTAPFSLSATLQWQCQVATYKATGGVVPPILMGQSCL